ncbi:putative ribonuclease H-like domain-containing protein, partial [Tanacetum coccineum]
VQDYALWEVIENGNSWVSVPQIEQENGTSITKMSVLGTAKEKTNKKNDVKAKSLLLMALPNEHQLTFNQYNDAKTMFAAIETRFGEDLNSKFLRSLPPEWNTHVVVWMNTGDIEIMSIDDLYNNFKVVEQDVNKFVGASTGTQNMAIMTAPSSSSTNNINTANPTNEASTVSPNINTTSPQVSTANFCDNDVYTFMVKNPNGSNLLQQDLEQIHEDDQEEIDLKWQLSLLSMTANRYFERTSKKIFINANDTAGYDKSKSDMVEEQVQTNKALMSFSDSEVYNDKSCTKTCLKNYETLKKQCDDLIVNLNQTEFKAATYKRGLATIEEQLVTYRKNEVLFSEEVAVLKRDVACKYYEIGVLKSKFENVKQEKEGIVFKIEKFDSASKSLDKLLGSQITDKIKMGLGYNVVPPPRPLIYNGPTKLDLSYSSLNEFKEPEFQCYGTRDSKQESTIDKNIDNSQEKSNDSLMKNKCQNMKINCNQHQRKRMLFGNNYNRVDYDYYAKTTHPSAQRNTVLRAVLLKSGLTPLNTPRASHKRMIQVLLIVDAQGEEYMVILLKIPRKDNKYSFDIKNIVPKESLTCLVTKATLEESMLWHRRLGHINYKNINKLIKENLVRDLPSKHFENDQTFVACLKGKQHIASCKSKVLNPITKPLFMLHMDLFGPTFVSSLMHKKYCLVVTDDYSRFTWVFFLATKDETSDILKNFIKEIENLVTQLLATPALNLYLHQNQ